VAETHVPTTTAPTFSIVVPTFRRPAALRQTLAALLALDYESDRYEIIVVDDDGGCAAADVVRQQDPGAVSVRVETQLQMGAARARNRGAQVASGDVLLFCDDDMMLAPGDLRARAETLSRHSDVAVSAAWQFGPGQMRALRASPFGRYRIELERRFQREVAGEALADDPECLRMELVAANNLALRRARFWEVGGFDEAFPFAGAEDQDFSLRARAAGMTLLLDTRILCFHNDNRLTIDHYCAREQRSAQTMAVLARKYPEQLASSRYVRENRPVERGDPPGLLAKKLLKAALATGPSLAAIHRLVRLLELAHVPDGQLRRAYSGLLGLHLFRGFRQAWAR
jgi:GT2 family glycosyltransferase